MLFRTPVTATVSIISDFSIARGGGAGMTISTNLRRMVAQLIFVGQQPVLKPGVAFQYSSWVPLHTPSGIMMGTYQMEAGNNEVFEVEIPVFSLDSPGQTTQYN